MLAALTVIAGLALPTGASAAPAAQPPTIARVATAVQVAGVAPAQAGTALVRASSGGNWAFALKANGQIFQTIRGTGAWFAPRDLGGPFRSGPAAVFQDNGTRVDLFAIYSDGSLKTSWFSNGAWSGWARIGTGFTGGVSVVRLPNDELHVFAIGTDSHLYETVRAGGRWQARRDLGGNFISSSSATYNAASGQLNVFAIGTDGRVRYRSRWGGWGPWQGATLGAGYTGVASVLIGSTLKVYAVNSNQRLYEFTRTLGSSSAPYALATGMIGTPAVAATSQEIRLVLNRTDGQLGQLLWQGRWSGWQAVSGSGFPSIVKPQPAPPPTRVQLAKLLLSRWGGRLTGLGGPLSDLQVTAAGGAIRSCGGGVYLDPRLLAAIVKATDKYQVFVNNMVTGHSCGSGYHPQGKAVDFNTVIDPATGRGTNWHSYESGDNRALDREFLSYVASAITSGGGAGQVNCPGSATAPVPAGMLRFADTCNHQHLDSR